MPYPARQQQLSQGGEIPAPMKGINTVDPLSAMEPTFALSIVNMRAGPYGMAVREGYKQWCQNVPLGDGVKTIIPANSSERLNVADKLFCVTADGIYDISLSGGVPIKVVDFALKTENSGWCSWHNFTNTAGAQYLLVCDLLNGYYTYEFATAIWIKVPGSGGGSLTGVDPALLCFVTVWKNRVWFVQRNSTRAWYLPVGNLTGAAVAFDFGAKFRMGGFLKGIYNWTVDGGAGIDDYLVGISSEGDVVLYQGTDPAQAAEFHMRGSWILGEVPRGRRIADDFGGDLLVATNIGIIPMSKIVAGIPVEQDDSYTTHYINPLYRGTFRERSDLFGFEIKYLTSEGLIMIVWPKLESADHVQLVYEPITKSWTIYQDLPIYTVENYRHKVYFGTRANEIFTYEGGVDASYIDQNIVPKAIEFKMLTAFNDMGSPSHFGQIQLIRPVFVADAIPQFVVEARYDYDNSDVASTPPYSPVDIALWDNAVWDNAVWSGGYQVDQPLHGAVGMGRSAAIVLKGEATGSRVVLVSFNVIYSGGGML